jgi:DHA3 family macrolide efflux protein-like MFS transporter
MTTTTPRPSWLRTFAVIYTGQAFSLLGSTAASFALVWWLAIGTGSAAVLAYASIAATLPQAVVMPLAGALVDRWDRRQVMIWADLAIAATSVVLVGLFSASSPATGVIYALIALRSLGSAFHSTASQAAVPMYVPAEELTRVAGWNFFLISGTAMAGPVLGAALMGAGSMSLVFAVDIVGAVIGAASLLLVRIPRPQRSSDDSPALGLRHDFTVGWRELAAHRGLWVLAVILTVVTVFYMPVNALFPLMTSQHFDGGAYQAGAVELAFGAGMLVGSLLVGWLAARFAQVRLISAGLFALGALLAASGLLPSTAYVVFVVLCVLMGLTAPIFSAPITAMLQTRIDPSKLGRVLSFYTTLTMLVVPLGLLLAGPAAERTGVAAWLAISGAAIAAAAVAVELAPSVRALRTSPPAEAAEDDTASLPAEPDAAEQAGSVSPRR